MIEVMDLLTVMVGVPDLFPARFLHAMRKIRVQAVNHKVPEIMVCELPIRIVDPEGPLAPEGTLGAQADPVPDRSVVAEDRCMLLLPSQNVIALPWEVSHAASIYVVGDVYMWELA